MLGFGTLIRSMGTQINKGSRKGACRDLSGRRMRDVEAEKKYVIVFSAYKHDAQDYLCALMFIS